MSLRRRLIVGALAVMATLAISIVVIVETERDHLVDQTDGELTSALPFAARIPLAFDLDAGGLPDEAEGFSDEVPASSVILGYVSEAGEVETILSGDQVDDEPELPLAELVDLGDSSTALNAPGDRTQARFRVVVGPRVDGDGWAFAARPLAPIDGAIARLRLQLLAASALILFCLVVTGWWIVRLGLRPIAEVTDAADAIAAGERGHRVDLDVGDTEAGRLGAAFNKMLDDRDANEAKLRQFVADASHELRTPLTSIRGYLELYVDGGFREPEALDDVVRRMRAESLRMNDLVEDLLLLASLDQGRPLAREPVDLGDVLRDAADDGRAIQRGRTIAVSVAEDDDLVVLGDDARLRQVVAALTHNALVHTPRTASIQLVGRLEGDTAVLAVVDDGPGMPRGRADHVFDRFYRGDASRSRHHGGSGLGLPIARSIVEAHDGRIWLETAPSAGCAFRIHLPARRRGASASSNVAWDGPQRAHRRPTGDPQATR